MTDHWDKLAKSKKPAQPKLDAGRVDAPALPNPTIGEKEQARLGEYMQWIEGDKKPEDRALPDEIAKEVDELTDAAMEGPAGQPSQEMDDKVEEIKETLKPREDAEAVDPVAQGGAQAEGGMQAVVDLLTMVVSELGEIKRAIQAKAEEGEFHG